MAPIAPDDEVAADRLLDALGELERELKAQSGGKDELIPPDMTFRQWCEYLAEKGLKIDGKAFSLKDRPALIPLYDKIPSTPKQAFLKTLVVMKATQLGLTVWEILANLYMAAKWEPVSIGMFMPDQSTAIFKSEHRFMRIVRSAPELYELLLLQPENAKRKKTEGNVLTRTLRESILMFLWTSGRVTTESRPMDIVTLDEVQEMALAQIDKVMERMGDSLVRYSLLLSTANMPESDIHYWYLLGDQQVWHTKCPACKKYSDLSDPVMNFPHRSIAYNTGRFKTAAIRDYCWTCPECGELIRDPQQGKYIATNPGASPDIESVLIPRVVSPRVTPREAYEKWSRAKTGDQKKSFYNRFLARPYVDADQLPVTMAHCLAAMDAGMRAGLQWEKSGAGTYMGIDQMGGFHTVIIKKRMPNGSQAVIHVEAIFQTATRDNPDASPWQRCDQLMKAYGVVVCVVEQLPNVDSARSFANRHPGKVFLAGYSDIKDSHMVWGDAMTESDRKTSAEDRSRYSVTLNQYKCMQTALYRVRDSHCLFPNADDLVQEVIDNGVPKRIPLLRDWVFVHFTKTALVVESPEEAIAGARRRKNISARAVRTKVAKIGLDPHFSFANMLCDVAWARSYGMATFILPDEEKPMADPNTVLAHAPQPLPVKIEPHNKAHICGNCSAFREQGNQCAERGMLVRAADPGCIYFLKKREPKQK